MEGGGLRSVSGKQGVNGSHILLHRQPLLQLLGKFDPRRNTLFLGEVSLVPIFGNKWQVGWEVHWEGWNPSLEEPAASFRQNSDHICRDFKIQQVIQISLDQLNRTSHYLVTNAVISTLIPIIVSRSCPSLLLLTDGKISEWQSGQMGPHPIDHIT